MARRPMLERGSAGIVLDWVPGDQLGLMIPAHIESLLAGGEDFLTNAFRAAGSLSAGNRVTRITKVEECPGGSTGRKLFLSVAYEKPGISPHEELFVKFSRDFDNPIRDRGKDQLESEVRFARVSRHPDFPIVVPACFFGDYHRETGTGILITERIAFGTGAIERQYDKCLDYEMPEALEHYCCVVTAIARLAGAHKSGRLGSSIDAHFPFDAEAAALSDPIRYDARQLRNRVARLADFASDYSRLLPANIVSPGFLAQLTEDMPLFLERQQAITHVLVSDPDLIALCHWNANIDNAWFWRDAVGALRCGLMDWGRTGQMNVAQALWGTFSAAEPEMLDDHLDALLTLFAREYAGSGGPQIPVEQLRDHMFLYAATMGMAWLLDAPALIRAQIPDLSASHDRFDPRFKANETARSQLHMLTNFLNLWETCGFRQVLDRVLIT